MRGNIQTVTLAAPGQAQASFHTHFQNRYVQSGTRGENIFPVCQFRAQFGNLCEAWPSSRCWLVIMNYLWQYWAQCSVLVLCCIHKTMRQNDVASLISDYTGDSNTRQIESVTRIRIFPFLTTNKLLEGCQGFISIFYTVYASSSGKVAFNHVLLWPGYGQCCRGRNTEVGVESLRSQSARAAFRGRARSWLAAAANIIKSWISPKFSSLTLHWAGHSRTARPTTRAWALIKLKRNSKPCMWPCTCHTQPVIIALKNIWSTKWKIFGHHRCCEMLTIGVLERNWAAVRTPAQLRAAVTGSGATERRWMAAPGPAPADLAPMFDEASTLHVYTWKP